MATHMATHMAASKQGDLDNEPMVIAPKYSCAGRQRFWEVADGLSGTRTEFALSADSVGWVLPDRCRYQTLSLPS
jgi:hypothetical protein